MTTPFVGEIRMFGGNFAPVGWALCDGQLLQIGTNTSALFSLLGTRYGGNGTTTFALPDLRGRIPIHAGGGHPVGERAGREGVVLKDAHLPGHTHRFRASTLTGVAKGPAERVPAAPPAIEPFASQAPDVAMAPGAVRPTGGAEPHDNVQPFLTLNFIIALQGIFPSRPLREAGP